MTIARFLHIEMAVLFFGFAMQARPFRPSAKRVLDLDEQVGNALHLVGDAEDELRTAYLALAAADAPLRTAVLRHTARKLHHELAAQGMAVVRAAVECRHPALDGEGVVPREDLGDRNSVRARHAVAASGARYRLALREVVHDAVEQLPLVVRKRPELPFRVRPDATSCGPCRSAST